MLTMSTFYAGIGETSDTFVHFYTKETILGTKCSVMEGCIKHTLEVTWLMLSMRQRAHHLLTIFQCTHHCWLLTVLYKYIVCEEKRQRFVHVICNIAGHGRETLPLKCRLM